MNVQKRLVNTSLKVAKLVIVVGGLFVQQQRPISKAGRILSDISESGLPPPSSPYQGLTRDGRGGVFSSAERG